MNEQATVLVVDDEPAIRLAIATALRNANYSVVTADSVGAARQHLAAVDLALLDHVLPDGSGLELLREAHELRSDLPLIMLTAHASVSQAVSAMSAGAFHYASKPIDLAELMSLVERGLEVSRLRRQVHALRTERERNAADQTIIGRSPQMRQVKRLITRVATSPGSTVLITGESGTGKDLAARAIHKLSNRADAPFLNINSSALPSQLLESELFGHERGAFTDAKRRKLGLLEHANHGTVFLDEIGDMEVGLQAKLLGFLESKTFRRIGSSTDIQADVRLVAATNVDLRDAVRKGAFRDDLYYRLAVLVINIPPLREREGDAELLAAYFVDRFAKEFGSRVDAIAPEALALIRSYPWPGNVRELKNAVERAVLLANSEVLTVRDFEMLTGTTTRESQFRLPLTGVDIREVECSLVKQALIRTGGNRTRAARLLGMNRDQIRYRIELFDIDMDAIAVD